jgi:hypothetical protein
MAVIVTERCTSADDVAHPPEHKSAEGPDQKTGCVGCEARQQCGGVVALGKEQGGEERGESRVEVEVVPLEDGTERRSEDDPLFFGLEIGMCGRNVTGSCCLTHRGPPMLVF